MKNTVLAALILALVSSPVFANTERKRNAEKPDYDAYKRQLAFEMALIPEGTMEIGKPVNVLLKLVDSKSGLAVPASFLRKTNGHTFHLLLADPTLTDHQHIHPAPTETDGLYRFTFTPRMPGGYRGWAHVVSVTDKQQFVMADLGRLRGSGMKKEVMLQTQKGGYSFKLAFDNTPKYKRSTDAQLTISKNGVAIKPDHIYVLGVHENLRTILKVKFEEGSKTAFEFKPEEPGFVKLFIYAIIGNKPPITAPLGFIATGEKSKSVTFESIF